jgi:hypothetical protein
MPNAARECNGRHGRGTAENRLIAQTNTVDYAAIPFPATKHDAS